jgi:hypothetical protein
MKILNSLLSIVSVASCTQAMSEHNQKTPVLERQSYVNLIAPIWCILTILQGEQYHPNILSREHTKWRRCTRPARRRLLVHIDGQGRLPASRVAERAWI